jgi:vacuolar-type H+-ATPase subunit C/Vma6
VIAHNVERELEKLRRIASENFTATLNIFLRENDAWNLKLIAEAIAGGSDPTTALKYYGKKGTFDASAFSSAKTIEELSKAAAGQIPALRLHPSTLLGFRDALENSTAAHLSRRAPRTQKYLIDEKNIIMILLLKRDNIPSEQMLRRIRRGGTLQRSVLREASAAPTIEDALRALRATKYSAVIEGATVEIAQGQLVRFEAELHNEVLRKIRKASASYPLHSELLLQYLTEKDIEHENIRLLIKGKRLGLDESFLRQHIVT